MKLENKRSHVPADLIKIRILLSFQASEAPNKKSSKIRKGSSLARYGRECVLFKMVAYNAANRQRTVYILKMTMISLFVCFSTADCFQCVFIEFFITLVSWPV